MKKRYSYVAVVVAVSLFSCAASSAEGRKNDLDSILSHFPGYHVLTLQERNSDARAFISDHFPKQNPSIVEADLNGDHSSDYALLLKHNKSRTTKLVVFFCSRDAVCRNMFEEDVTSSFGEVYIRPVPIGSQVSQTDAIPTDDYPSPVTLKSTGIELTYFGQAKVVYYWNQKHKKMETVQTED